MGKTVRLRRDQIPPKLWAVMEPTLRSQAKRELRCLLGREPTRAEIQQQLNRPDAEILVTDG